MHIAFINSNVPLFNRNKQKIYNCYESLKKTMNKGCWELLYGVPGFLYAVLELQKHYDSVEL